MASFLDNLKFVNPFSKAFRQNDLINQEIQRQIESNSQGMSEIEYDFFSPHTKYNIPGYAYGDYTNTGINFNQIFIDKRQRIAKYREMSYYPEISEGLDIISDESIVEDSEGNIIHLNIKKELPKRVEKLFTKEFEYVSKDVFDVNENLYDLFLKWLIEGELYVELILDKKRKNVIGYKVLPAFTTYPVYNPTGSIKGFLQNVYDERTGKDDLKAFESNQVVYVHYGKYGRNLLDIRGYLETSIRTYNQLKNLEDSLVVYRLVRAPERRVWNIEVGRMPSHKAEEYIRKIIHKYKRQLNYNPATGAIDSSRNVQSLSEDFWFARREGSGTNVETLQSGMNLGELEDVRYFQGKMYKTLKIPKTRWDPQLGQQSYQSGREMDRDELKFSLFIIRLQKRFRKLIKDTFMEQLKFKFGKDAKIKKYINSNFFDVYFTQANFFKEIKDLELLESRLNILGTAITYAINEDEPNNPLARELVLRDYFMMSDEEWAKNQRLLKKEKKAIEDMPSDEDEEGDEGDEGDEEGGSPEKKPEGPEKPPPEEAPREPEEEEESLEMPGDRSYHKNSKLVKDFLKRPRKTKKVL